MMRSTVIIASIVVTLSALTACGSDADGDEPAPNTRAPETAISDDPGTAETAASTVGTDEHSDDADEQRFPDVIDATAEQVADTWTISATLSSPYDTPDRYADAWRVIGPDGAVYGERVLAHDHAGEQPFTRSESGIEIPDDVAEVVIEGRDLEYGYGGATFTLVLPR